MTTNADKQPPTRLSTEQAAAYLGKPVSTLRWYRSMRKGPRSYRLGRAVFYDLADLQAWEVAERARSERGGVDA
ncbi:helix-turn-helix domain-containing protein [Mycobacterium sp. SMC-8]|uniref:helix-turn-helix transcriptional regulator n=1 Tax=Mycobacterium sp. SMC-8 TaxID=2857060 RepID=UPI0021B23484|nr:helix-turn-helix domain-containing protein [Mycobacterium sp. SMC-8]UXA12387.1 helix-turn-helix domain-containing protein [Mycobacterium sp. SMC-8]